jgi:hypothetical protein
MVEETKPSKLLRGAIGVNLSCGTRSACTAGPRTLMDHKTPEMEGTWILMRYRLAGILPVHGFSDRHGIWNGHARDAQRRKGGLCEDCLRRGPQHRCSFLPARAYPTLTPSLLSSKKIVADCKGMSLYDTRARSVGPEDSKSSLPPCRCSPGSVPPLNRLLKTQRSPPCTSSAFKTPSASRG